MGSACASGYTDVRVKGNTTPKDDVAAAAAAGKPAPKPGTFASTFVQADRANRNPLNPLGFGIAPPQAPPDMADAILKQRKASQMLLLLAGRGRRQAFLGEGYGPSALTANFGTGE